MIGYNRTVKLRWLDETVDLYVAGMADDDIYESLQDRLKDELSVGSTAIRGSREKTITLLLKTWVRVPKALQPLRDEGAKLLQGVRRSERLPFHWGMTMAVYPFWRLVAEVTGRLFRLQETVTPLQVQRRVKEIMGEREAVARSTRYVLRAFADWGVISDSAKKGEYSPTQPIPVVDLEVVAWFLETAVISRGASASDFQTLVNGPCLFPFRIGKIAAEQLGKSGRLEVIRHGMEETLVHVRACPKVATLSTR
jgi:hypothetical protein